MLKTVSNTVVIAVSGRLIVSALSDNCFEHLDLYDILRGGMNDGANDSHF
jgi:hypothetical protein